MNTTRNLKSMLIAASLITSSLIPVAQAKDADELKDSYRPALNYPQSVAWAKKRPIDSLYAFRASDVLGKTLYNGVGDEVGEVDDVLIPVDRADSKLLVIVEVGGFLGIGEKLVAVPHSEFRVGKSGFDEIYLNVTKEQLESLETFSYSAGERSRKESMTDGE